MIYREKELKEKIIEFAKHPENEVVEFKAVNKTANYSFKNIGKYFSALSNEANIRGLREGWLIFGIADDGSIVGTAYRISGGLQSLKKEIREGTNENLTFLDIYEISIDGKG